MPSFDVTVGHFTLIPNPFWGGVAFPLVVLVVLAAFPWVEARLTRDRTAHNLADRPRDAPNQTAFGFAFLSWIFLIFAFGAADRILVLWGLGYNTQLNMFRVAIWVIPFLLFLLVRRICRELQASDRIEADRASAEERAEQHERALAATQSP
ncbi:MAG: hypothetical protein ACRDKL_11945, partial [Solirubrobacteraceae bacterium]